MDRFKIQIIETIIVIIAYVVLFIATKTVINNALKNTNLQKNRRKIIIKVAHLLTSIVTLVLIAAIWGLKQNQIAIFASTIITALGIAFFAQWSLLSNITASLILFFNHPLKIGDYIKVLDRDYPYEGEITDLTYFFAHLKTKNNEVVTIPNSLLLQKSVSIVSKQELK